MNMSYSEVLKMPTYERRYFIDLKIKRVEKQNNKEPKGKKGKKLSGEALKAQLKKNNNDIDKIPGN